MITQRISCVSDEKWQVKIKWKIFTQYFYLFIFYRKVVSQLFANTLIT